MKYFVLFKRQTGQKKHAYSVVDKELFPTLPINAIKATKEIGDVEIVTKKQCREWVKELGGKFYED